MFEENNNTVTEVTENVVPATEEIVEDVVTSESTENVVTDAAPVEEKLYTKQDLETRMKNRTDRLERKLRREYESKYGKLENVIKAGLKVDSIEEATNQMESFYTQKGVPIPKYEPSYNDNDMKVLANAEAQSIIELGFEEVVEEVERLAEIGIDNMSPREKIVFNQLATYRKVEESKQELAKIGVTEKALEDKNYIEFAKNLNPNMSEKEKYEFYLKNKPKPEVTPMGSMKGTKSEESAVKDFYSFEEAMKFTKDDFDRNPELFKAVEKSMAKWK